MNPEWWLDLLGLAGLILVLGSLWSELSARKRNRQKREVAAFVALMRTQAAGPRCPVCHSQLSKPIIHDGRADIRQCVHGHVYCMSQVSL
jgi:hypothetical protein